MDNFRIQRPVFEQSVKGKIEYSIEMQQHLQALEDFYKMLGEADEEGWGICQMWVLQHKDGRVANLPDVCPYEQMRRRAERREKAWMRYYMKKRERLINKNQNIMNEKTESKYSGAVLFNGKIEIAVNGVKKQLRIDYLGGRLHQVDPEREVIIMRKGNVEYQELDTGFVFFTDEMKENLTFGLKPQADSKSYCVYSASDVIAWGYADEGDDSQENLKGRIEEIRRNDVYRRAKKNIQDMNVCIAIQEKDGQIGVKVIVDKNEIDAYLVVSADYLAQCLEAFQDFIKFNPEIKEMHFFTKPTEWNE